QLLDRLVSLVVRVGPTNFFAQLEPIQRWLTDVDAAVLDERPEVAVQESQKERADVRAIDVSVCEQDRLAVAELLDVEVVAYSGPESGDERFDLLVPEHLVRAGLLDIQDLSAKRQDRLEPPVSAALRTAAGRDPLDDDQLALLGIALRAVGELAREREAIQRALALHEIARLARRLTCTERSEALLDDALRIGGVLLEILAEGVVHGRGDLTGPVGVAESGLRLALELGLADLHADDRRESFPDIVRGEIRVGVL